MTPVHDPIIDPDAIPERLPEWIRDHLRRYVTTDGVDGHLWRGVPTLLLRTVGRRSGQPLVLPLIYGRDGDAFVVVASKGGAPAHPAWYLNLLEANEVAVQVADRRFRALARTADPDEHARLWPRMVEIWPDYAEYQSRTTREIPIVLLTPLT
ncbi:MAG: nitroreductase family deazaflavin-dependent oxidoreductase [Pseudomonadales bacterium]|jgi:deazaflavin-dependent oxidoreductase (nitroreductase family)|nr:nitroreductase family deazaflavin-dependent oxidoreductase [Pseudomonadales bacterium]